MLQVAALKGQVRILEVPAPAVRPGGVLVRTSHSVISVGTESASVGGGESLVIKALRNPQLVRKVMDRVSSHGLRSTAEVVRARLSEPQSMGYSCAGVVAEVGKGVGRFRVGDRVACCGAGYANHAGFNFVPENLVARLPDNVAFEEGAFATLGSIALQGIRRCAPELGDRVVVLGLGLIGQLTHQLLRAAGAHVIGVDVRAQRVERAIQLGMPDGFCASERNLVAGVLERTGGRGADAVIVTAAGGDTRLLNQCFDACRRKGRVILVGDVPIRIQRDRIYKKELDFLISTSYGPGRYDPDYEEHGVDYPFAYVRWTEGRNLEEVLRQIAIGTLQVRPLIDASYPVEQAEQAYASLAGENRPIGVLLDYQLDSAAPVNRAYLPRRSAQRKPDAGKINVGVIGYGSYFRSTLLPLLRAHGGFLLRTVCARTGLSVQAAVDKDGFERGTTDYAELLADPTIEAVYIATRHDQHFAIARDAILAGKAVFVEKPMTMTVAQGVELAELVTARKALLTVGFNRRFAPHAVRLKELLTPIAAPKTIVYRVNAGALPAGHWTLDPAEGGGRILGEGVHFFDFMSFLCGAEPVRVVAQWPAGRFRNDASVSLAFADGSVGTLVYTSDGPSGLSKERVEVFAGGAGFVLDDFRSLEVFGLKAKGVQTRTVQKGQAQQLGNFHGALRGSAELGVTVQDGLRATWCAEQVLSTPPYEA